MQDIALLGIEGMRCAVGVRHLQVFALELDRIDSAAITQFHLGLTGGVEGNIVQGLDRCIKWDAPSDSAVLDHTQDELRSADLQVRRDLTHIRIAEYNMQPPKAPTVSMRLIARVQQGTSGHGVNTEHRFAKVRPLGDLITCACP